MIEILADLEVLKRPRLALPELSLDGVAFGARGRMIPRAKIVEVSGSPSVARSHSGTSIRADGARRPVPAVGDIVSGMRT